jgi:hypothetical protein
MDDGASFVEILDRLFLVHGARCALDEEESDKDSSTSAHRNGRGSSMSSGDTMAFKERALLALQTLPTDAEYEEALDCLNVVHQVREALVESDRGMGVPHDEAMRRMRQWLT